MKTEQEHERKLTGGHVLAIFCIAFGTIITVNLTLAYSAVSTFPGVETKNSYIASQSFDDRRAAQESLGWDVAARIEEGGLSLAFTDADGRAIEVARLHATLGRATHVQDDQAPIFTFDGERYTAPAKLGPGYWNLRMRAIADDGTAFEQRIELFVKG